MGQTRRQDFQPAQANAQEACTQKEVLMQLADELLQDNYGSLRFRELIQKTNIVDTGIRWQVSNEITRRLLQHVLDRSESWKKF